MSLAPGVSGPIHVCRRLFGETAYSRVQQTVEAVIRQDAERFAKAWNFPFARCFEAENRQPLVQKNITQPNVESKSSEARELLKNGWQVICPEASFYSTPPRKIKAHRRLGPSVAQKVQQELSQTTRLNTNPGEIQDTTSLSSQPSLCQQDSIVDLFKPVLSSTGVVNEKQTSSEPCIPKTPIIIRPAPTDTSLPLPYLEQLKATESPLSKPTVPKSRLTIVRSSRFSEQIVKRKPDARVTDYFAVNKRPRQSLK